MLAFASHDSLPPYDTSEEHRRPGDQVQPVCVFFLDPIWASRIAHEDWVGEGKKGRNQAAIPVKPIWVVGARGSCSACDLVLLLLISPPLKLVLVSQCPLCPLCPHRTHAEVDVVVEWTARKLKSLPRTP